MAGTLFFVHGTGVRQEGYDRTWTAVKEGAIRNGVPASGFCGSAWGPKLGVRADRIADTLPAEAVTKDALGDGPQPSEEELQTAAWALLLDDPLFELRLAAADGTAAVSTKITVGEERADQATVTRLGALADSPPDLTGTGVGSEEFRRAASAVADSEDLHEAALASPSVNDPELIDTVARAVVATVLATHLPDPPGTMPTVALDGAVRDGLVELVASSLLPVETRGKATGWIKRKAVAFAARKAANIAVDRRVALMDSSLPGIGDILFYQRRGDAIRDLVGQDMAGLPRPIVAVGHSLGGIVLVDLLSRGATEVDLLVTAGSQSPLFYAIDALGWLRPGQTAPTPFSPWLNIYNRQDLLSFCATRIFAGVDGILDEEVDPGVPFPASHSAYWHHDRVFQLIRENWPAGSP